MNRIRFFIGAAAVAATIVSGAVREPGQEPVGSAAPGLADLRGVDEMKTLFNQDAGKVRLVLLVSPT